MYSIASDFRAAEILSELPMTLIWEGTGPLLVDHVTVGTGIPLAPHWNSIGSFTCTVAYRGEIETDGLEPKEG